MYYLFLSLTVLAIISQTLHTYFVFDAFSRLEGSLKLIQAILFCSIISVAIFGFVYVGKTKLALLGAFIEVVINIYYYAKDFWENGIRARVHRLTSIATFWRKNWVSMFFGLLIPVLIYVFAEQMIELK
jgi:hypothetical protein